MPSQENLSSLKSHNSTSNQYITRSISADNIAIQPVSTGVAFSEKKVHSLKSKMEETSQNGSENLTVQISEFQTPVVFNA